MKAMMLSNQSRSMAIFWRVLITSMIAKKINVVCCVPEGDNSSDAELEKMGAEVIHYPLDRKGINPINDISTYRVLKKIFAQVQPDILFATTIKPVIYGCMAAAGAGVKGIFATITGLGYAFETDSFLKKIINKIGVALYRTSLKHANGIFFQNRDDIALFREKGILAPEANVLIARGTGVDTRHFAPVPFPSGTTSLNFLLVGRLLEAKGLRDYAAAAGILKKKYPDARFQLLGPIEEGFGSIDISTIKAWQEAGLIEYLGETRDVRPYVAKSHVIVLPSWREGTPTSIMEAMSMGRPCVVTDVPGCREVVTDGLNGFLAQCRNPDSLADAMEKFLFKPDLVCSMGKESAKLAVEKFSAEKVAQTIMDDMRAALPDKTLWPDGERND